MSFYARLDGHAGAVVWLGNDIVDITVGHDVIAFPEKLLRAIVDAYTDGTGDVRPFAIAEPT
jgi:hypothetical protein